MKIKKKHLVASKGEAWLSPHSTQTQGEICHEFIISEQLAVGRPGFPGVTLKPIRPADPEFDKTVNNAGLLLSLHNTTTTVTRTMINPQPTWPFLNLLNRKISLPVDRPLFVIDLRWKNENVNKQDSFLSLY